jgi:hypothetical protein
MPSTVTVHYPFHPLHKCCLDVVAWPRHAANAATVQHPDGKTLKIPLWMLQPEAARFALAEQPELSANALLALVDVMQTCSKVSATKQPEHCHAASHTRSRPQRERPTGPSHGTGTATTAHYADGTGHCRGGAKRSGRRP